MNGALVDLFPFFFFFFLLFLFLSHQYERFSSSFSFTCLFKPVAPISPGQGSCFYARSDIPRFMHTNPAIFPDVER